MKKALIVVSIIGLGVAAQALNGYFQAKDLQQTIVDKDAQLHKLQGNVEDNRRAAFLNCVGTQLQKTQQVKVEDLDGCYKASRQ